MTPSQLVRDNFYSSKIFAFNITLEILLFSLKGTFHILANIDLPFLYSFEGSPKILYNSLCKSILFV